MKTASLFVVAFLLFSCLFFVQNVSALENSWMVRPPLLESTSKAVAVDGKIYAMGTITQEYNPDTLTWTKKNSMPHQVNGGIAVYQNKIYVIGENYNQVYDVRSDTWAIKTAMPTWRTGLQANVVGDKIYLMGGLSNAESGTLTGVNEVYDPTTDTWMTKAPIPTPVYLYSSAVMDNKIYVIGGSAEPPNIVLDLVQIYDPQKDIWTNGTAMPKAVRYASAIATTGLFAPKQIYVIGGLKSGNGLDLNQIYNPQTDSWTTGTPMPTARYNLGLAVINDTVYAMGGVLLPPYAFPQEPLTTNEIYLPLNYDGPTPPCWQPQPSPTPSISSSPTLNSTPSTTISHTLSQSPSTSPESELPFNSILVIITVALAVFGLVAILLAVIKRRK
jgi:N-acetylneuraminic acid mutarotase